MAYHSAVVSQQGFKLGDALVLGDCITAITREEVTSMTSTISRCQHGKHGESCMTSIEDQA